MSSGLTTFGYPSIRSGVIAPVVDEAGYTFALIGIDDERKTLRSLSTLQKAALGRLRAMPQETRSARLRASNQAEGVIIEYA
jgi:hypothetical protein